MDTISFTGTGSADVFTSSISAFNKTTGHSYSQTFNGTYADVLAQMADVMASWMTSETIDIQQAAVKANPPSN